MDIPLAIDGTIETSFCFKTITERWPKIITKIIDHLHQYYKEVFKQFGKEGENDVKYVMSKLSELRYLIITGKLLENIINASDAELWNTELQSYKNKIGQSNITWFKLPWLFTECYMYKKIADFFTATKFHQKYDYFKIEKQTAFFENLPHMVVLSNKILNFIEKNSDNNELNEMVLTMLQLSLWSNKCDLSLSCGDSSILSEKTFQELTNLQKKILVNDLNKVCTDYLLNKKMTRIDVVLDNAGFELFTDLCLADVLISSNITQKIVFHGKEMPWFVSDTTLNDLNWMINKLVESADLSLNKLGVRWKKYLEKDQFLFKCDSFWTYPFAYYQMKEKGFNLYNDLKTSDFIIFKGDLNYRKLVGDCYWPYEISFEEALRGFKPTSFLALRTLKAEIVVGLSELTLKELNSQFDKEDKSWLVTGDYAVAQLFSLK